MLCFAKMSAKQGIKSFKWRSVSGIVKLYKQFHEVTKFGRVCLDDLVPKKAIQITCDKPNQEKKCRKVKGRACEYGREQRAYIKK